MKLRSLVWVIWRILILGLFLISLVTFFTVHMSYTTSLPHQPDMLHHRVIPLKAKGGIIYANEAEHRLWTVSLNAFGILVGCVFITAIAHLQLKEKNKPQPEYRGPE